ncbi:hypothetical protein HZC07_05660 [Candidatus Micrarchaeota archaeon]|nr:hypothetical protein [Candidatus Micrarchaeota archaeon]
MALPNSRLPGQTGQLLHLPVKAKTCPLGPHPWIVFSAVVAAAGLAFWAIEHHSNRQSPNTPSTESRSKK